MKKCEGRSSRQTRASRGCAVMEVLVRLIAVLLLVTSIYGRENLLDYEYIPQDNNTLRTRPADELIKEYYGTIRKCHCGGNAVWDERGCTEMDTYVAVTNSITNQVGGVPTDEFEVTVGEIRCSQPTELKVILDPEKGFSNQFSLLSNGSLYWQRYPYENYCFDHKLDEEGKPNTWEAMVCVPPPVIPRCCHNASPAAGGSCTSDSTHKFSPPVYVNGSVLQWPLNVTEESVNMKCNELENLLTLQLNSVNAVLKFETGGVSVVWLPKNSRRQMITKTLCVDAEAESGNYTALVCHEDQIATYKHMCNNSTCVRKCCREDEVMYEGGCSPVREKTYVLMPTFRDADDFESLADPPNDLTWLYGAPQCAKYELEPDTIQHDKYFLLDNGNLLLPLVPKSYLPTRYCIDNFLDSVEEDPRVGVLACFPEGTDDPGNPICATFEHKVYPALLLVSSFFLGITLVIYISLPDIRNKLHGRCLISLAAALFVAYSVMATTRLAAGKLAISLCKSLASLTHYSFLASFFWLNVMCFDMWNTLRKTRTMVDGGRAAVRRFLLYSLYAWGCPLIITIAAIVVNKLPSSYNVIRPNFSAYCWFRDEKAHWVYLYGWVLTLVIVNVIFFILVSIILCKAQNNEMIKRSRDYNKERMWLYLKLLLVMGVIWVAELVSWLSSSCRASIATDVLNALQGLSLFLVYVCRKPTLHKIKQCCGLAQVERGSRRGYSNRMTLTSFANYSIFRKRRSNLSSSATNSTRNTRISDTYNMRPSNNPSSVTLNTVQEDSSCLSDISRYDPQETTTKIPKEDRQADRESGNIEETASLRTFDPTSPAQLLETHLEGCEKDYENCEGLVYARV